MQINTVAKIVRGHHVKIGPNCLIGIVEYTEDFSQDKNAVISNVRKAQ
jgi:hypothetical protein